MNKKQDIEPFNDNGYRHGYWESYYNGTLFFKANFINGNVSGYYENFYNNNGINRKQFYLR